MMTPSLSFPKQNPVSGPNSSHSSALKLVWLTISVLILLSSWKSCQVEACGQAEWVCYVVPRQSEFTEVEQNLRCYNPNVEHCVDDWVCARDLDARCGDICYNSKTHVCHEGNFKLCHIGAKGYCAKTDSCFDDTHYICDPVRGLVHRGAVNAPPPVPAMPVIPPGPASPPAPNRAPQPQPRPIPGSYTYRYVATPPAAAPAPAPAPAPAAAPAPARGPAPLPPGYYRANPGYVYYRR